MDDDPEASADVAGASGDALPVIDVGALLGDDDAAAAAVGRQLDAACRSAGFFVAVGHGVGPTLRQEMEVAARAFFALPDLEKAEVAMARGGRAWRGWFPVGGELTSGVPDRKEGLYLGADLPEDDPRVVAGRPLHGPNLWPVEPATLRPAVEAWMAAMTSLGHRLMEGLALGLGLPRSWFAENLTGDPVTLFRIFHYPPTAPDAPGWGVAEHTDYGLLTLLAQDDHAGLEVRTPAGWTPVPARPDALVCNIGDVLDRLTGGRYRSTPHRVRPSTGEGRLSFPFFFDPSWDAEIAELPLTSPPAPPAQAERWDGTDLQTVSGTYGAYLTAKVAKAFPGLADGVGGLDP